MVVIISLRWITNNDSMATTAATKSINWQSPLVDNSEISETDYRAMVGRAEKSGYMSNETHCRELTRGLMKFQQKKQLKTLKISNAYHEHLKDVALYGVEMLGERVSREFIAKIQARVARLPSMPDANPKSKKRIEASLFQI